jgi:hypothetical protein
VLGEALGGRHVQLFTFADDTVLLSPDESEALSARYGGARAAEILSEAGLSGVETVNWGEVLRWYADTGLEPYEAPNRDARDFAKRRTRNRDWHLQACSVHAAWKALGGPGSIDWGRVRVGQIDTGYTAHPVFGFPDTSWIDEKAARSMRGSSPTPDGVDPLAGGNDGHGTRTASVICGFDRRYRGVAPKVPLVPVRIGDCVIIDRQLDEFAAALRYLVDEARVGVVSVSMGTFLRRSAPHAVRRAVDHCYERGVILVAAAGNVPVRGWPAYPASLARTIAVAGVTSDARPWGGGSRGDWVDLSAPAMDVRHASTEEAARYGHDATSSGTSYATAMTAGAAALWLVAHAARIDAAYPHPWQRVEAFRLAARRTARKLAARYRNSGNGAGILNVARLVAPAALPPAGDLVAR